MLVILVVLWGSSPAATAASHVAETPASDPVREFRLLTRAVRDLLNEHGAPTLWLKDELGEQILEHYLNGWDPGRKLLMSEDVESAMRHRHSISDELGKGDASVPLAIFRLLKARLETRLTNYLQLLRQGFDFERDEVLTSGLRDREWTTADTDLAERWRKCVKNDVIELRLLGRTPMEIVHILERRYLAERDRLKQVDTGDVLGRWLNAYVHTLDPHGAYLSPRVFENLEIQEKGYLVGIGVVLGSGDQYPVIEDVVPGSPAAQSGKVHIGDRIVEIKDFEDSRFLDVLGWPLRKVATRLRGPRESIVDLHILSAGPRQKSRKVRLVRDRFVLWDRSVTAKLIETGDPERPGKVGVIEIPTFGMNADRDFHGGTSGHVRRFIRRLRATGMEGLVLDLRRNSGGSILEAVRIAGLFVPGGPIMQIRSHTGKVRIYRDPDPNTEWRGPLSVLVGPKSASAAEIVAAALQDYRRGIVIGERTFGKGTVQRIIRLDDIRRGAALKITSSRWYRVTGESIEGRGVYPDIDLATVLGSEHPELQRSQSGPERPIESARWDPYHLKQNHVVLVRGYSRKRTERSPAVRALREDADERMRSPTTRPISLHLKRRWAEHYERERRRSHRIKTLREEFSADHELRNLGDLSKLRNAFVLREATRITLDLGVRRSSHR